jgi:hypothetical protein
VGVEDEREKESQSAIIEKEKKIPSLDPRVVSTHTEYIIKEGKNMNA